MLYSLPVLLVREDEGRIGVVLSDGVRVGDKQERSRLAGVVGRGEK